ncbi:MAG: hypothetical protein SGBAC_006045 [Bacillariaceae sp.]
MYLKTTARTSPCTEECKKDVSMVMPTRRPSISSLPRLIKPLSNYLSSSSSSLTLSSLRQRASLDSSMGSSSSFHISSNDLSFSFATTVVFETPEDEGEEERRARFAPSPTTMTTAGLCLDDYTPEELEACWYSRDDIQYMRAKRKRKQARKIFKKKSKRLQRKILKREDTRWNV